MKKLLLRLALFALLVPGLGVVARAAVDTSAVPADAKWMVQVDFAALRECPVGRELIAMVEKDADIPVPSVNVKIDVKKVLATVETATAYGTVFSKNPDEMDGTLLIKGTDDLRKIAEAVVTQASISQPDTVAEIKGLPFTAYVIKGKITIAFPEGPVVLVSRSQAQLVKAYDLFRGKGASSARGPSSLKAMVPKDRPVVIFAASEVPNTEGLFDENQPQARILKMASAASVAVGDSDKQATATVQLVASTEDNSDKLLKIVQGMVAMISLAESDDKQLNEFMKSLKAERNDRSIMVSFSYPNDGLIQMMRNFEQAQTHPAEQPAHHAKKDKDNTRVIDTWEADTDSDSESETPQMFETRTTKEVALKNGTVVIVTGKGDDGDHAGIDYVEVESESGEQPLHFEAENMKLRHYRIEKSGQAAGGRVIVLDGSGKGTARFEFPGAAGTYRIKIHYQREDGSDARFSVSLQDPDTGENETGGNEPAVPKAPEPPKKPNPPGQTEQE